MAKVCEITGARVRRGSRIHRSGLAKKKVELVDTLPRLLSEMFHLILEISVFGSQSSTNS